MGWVRTYGTIRLTQQLHTRIVFYLQNKLKSEPWTMSLTIFNQQSLIKRETSGNHNFIGFHLSRPDLSQKIRQKLIQKNCLKMVDPIDPMGVSMAMGVAPKGWSVVENPIKMDEIWSNGFLLLCSFETSIGPLIYAAHPPPCTPKKRKYTLTFS